MDRHVTWHAVVATLYQKIAHKYIHENSRNICMLVETSKKRTLENIFFFLVSNHFLSMRQRTFLARLIGVSGHRCECVTPSSPALNSESFLSRTSLFGVFGTTPFPQTYVDVDRAPTPTTRMSLAISLGPWPQHGRDQVYLHGWAYIYTTRVTVVFTSTSPGARSFCSGVESATNCKYLIEIIDFWRRI